MQRGEIHHRAHFRVATALREHVQVLFRAIVLAGETKQLEQESSALAVGRVVPDLGRQRLQCLVELTGLE
jgi:hypothetical protein